MKLFKYGPIAGNRVRPLGDLKSSSKPPAKGVKRPSVDVQRGKTDDRMGAGLLELAAVWGKK